MEIMTRFLAQKESFVLYPAHFGHFKKYQHWDERNHGVSKGESVSDDSVAKH